MRWALEVAGRRRQARKTRFARTLDKSVTVILRFDVGRVTNASFLRNLGMIKRRA
ncbi:MAG TPA: hypothetical protein VN034_05595 [Sphingopyxis sp.]|nr:hypothetical protein [Sphingopyxis sp.]